MTPYVLVTGDFVPHGGMDRPNYELAWHLADRVGAPVHLVAHRVAKPLAEHRNIRWHRVPLPLGRQALGARLLAWAAQRVASRLACPGVRVVVNGGNCRWPDVNWVHAVHAAWDTRVAHASALVRLRAAWGKRRARRDEHAALTAARLVVTNSARARDQILEHHGLHPERVRVVYYGIDSEAFSWVNDTQKQEIRVRLGWESGRPVVAFVGVLGWDRNKGFDVLFEAWRALCGNPDWDADLVVAGSGREVGYWRRQAEAAGLAGRVRLLGFTPDIPDILGAADALVSPTHYDAYGQGVHEALCRGLPAFVSRSAGVAERYPAELDDLLLDSPPRPADLIARLRRWRANLAAYRARVRPFGDQLRGRSWDQMAAEMAELIETAAAR